MKIAEQGDRETIHALGPARQEEIFVNDPRTVWLQQERVARDRQRTHRSRAE
jgi:hypothetical protein